MAYGIFVLYPGIEPMSPTIEAWSPNHWTTREFLAASFDACCCCSVIQLCLTLWDPMDCNTPGFPVLHYLLEFAQTHVNQVGDAIQPSHPLLPPSPPTLRLS